MSPRPALGQAASERRLRDIPKSYSLKHQPKFFSILSQLKKEGLAIPNSHLLKDFRKERALSRAAEFIQETVRALRQPKP